MIGIVIAGLAEGKGLLLSTGTALVMRLLPGLQFHLPGGLSSSVSCRCWTAATTFSSRARSWRLGLLARGYWILLFTSTQLGSFDSFPKRTRVNPELTWKWRSPQLGPIYLSSSVVHFFIHFNREILVLSRNPYALGAGFSQMLLNATFSEFAPCCYQCDIEESWASEPK